MPTEKSFSTPPLIALQGVRKSYNLGLPSEVEVLHGVDLCMQPGEFIALVGPSGSGKSTLLNVLGLLERMSSGSYQLQGRETSDLDDDGLTLLRRQSLGFVFQFHHLLPAFTALENVTLPALMAQGVVTGQDRRRAMDLLEAVGLEKALHKKPAELSGGMQQRVAIARALVGKPAILLADEPTGALDVNSGKEVLKLFENLNQMGNTIVMITHDLNVAKHAGRVVRIVDGEIYEN